MLGNSWGYLFFLYVFVQISRVVVIRLLFSFLQYFGYGLDWKEAIILVWSGLKRAIGFSLSLSVKVSLHNCCHLVFSFTYSKIFFFFFDYSMSLHVIIFVKFLDLANYLVSCDFRFHWCVASHQILLEYCSYSVFSFPLYYLYMLVFTNDISSYWFKRNMSFYWD